MLLFISSAAAFAQKIEAAPKAGNPAAPAAQPSSASNPVARAATEALVAKYTLGADQAKQMYQIQVRKMRNLSAIAELKSSNPALYQRKLQALQTNTWTRIRRILNTKKQVELYKKTQADLQIQRTEKRQELLRQNADRAAIELAVLEVYAE